MPKECAFVLAPPPRCSFSPARLRLSSSVRRGSRNPRICDALFVWHGSHTTNPGTPPNSSCGGREQLPHAGERGGAFYDRATT
eukprot:6193805-Prymnesium_polylepis.1